MQKALQVILAALLLTIFGQALYAQNYGRWVYLGEANVDGSFFEVNSERIPAGWVSLGESNVDGNTDHDKIKIGRDDGRFRAIQIRVERAPIEFYRVVVHYGNGADEEIAIRNRINPGGRTRVIDLRGRDRVIESVEVWYARAKYDSAKPKLRLFGLP
jgi:hypothetical protein